MMNLPDELPNELLAEIFRNGVDLDRDEKQPRSLTTYCSVNARWRALCHQTPELWTDIRIPLIHVRSQATFEKAQIWFERSKTQLIDVTLIIVKAMLKMATHDDYDVMRDTVIMLESHISRIRRFNFWSEIPFGSCLINRVSYHLHRYHAPHLTDICLKFGFPPGTSNDNRHVIAMARPARVPLFNSAPQLRHQTLRGINLQFPLSGLRSLDLFDIIPTQWSLHDLSIDSPALEELRLLWLHPMRDPGRFDSWPTEYLFPALRSLVVSFIPYWIELDHSISALALMSCPNLEFLEIRGPFVPNTAVSFFDPTLLARLHTLCLQDVKFVKPSLLGVDCYDLTFYLALTSVQHLQLKNTPLEPLFLKEDTKRKSLLRSRLALQPKGLSRIQKEESPAESGPFPSENPSALNPRAASSHTYWPNLNAITLDTAHTKDIICLCKLIAERPEIKTVYLSPSAKRLLASSVTVRRGDQTDRVSSHWDLNLKKKNWVRKDRIDPVAWLEQRVEVREYHAKKETFH
ncbi:hypothetical protein FB446DRAFT_775092 [Lentinula raphanica]|nr:hypothetical protein FB446DRAFT_775092 [Lentinula raphanica]